MINDPLRDADYIRSVNLFKLNCTTLNVRNIRKEFREFSKKIHPDKASVPNDYFHEMTFAYNLLKKSIKNPTDLFNLVCDGNEIKKIEGKDKEAGDLVPKIFDYCTFSDDGNLVYSYKGDCGLDPDNPYNFKNYSPADNYYALQYLTARTNEGQHLKIVHEEVFPDFKFPTDKELQANDGALLGEMREVAAFIEEMYS